MALNTFKCYYLTPLHFKGLRVNKILWHADQMSKCSKSQTSGQLKTPGFPTGETIGLPAFPHGKRWRLHSPCQLLIMWCQERGSSMTTWNITCLHSYQWYSLQVYTTELRYTQQPLSSLDQIPWFVPWLSQIAWAISVDSIISSSPGFLAVSPQVTYALVTCEIQLFQKYFSLRRRPSETILADIISELFQRHWTRWKIFVSSAAFQNDFRCGYMWNNTLKYFQCFMSYETIISGYMWNNTLKLLQSYFTAHVAKASVINSAVGCRYFPSGRQLLAQPKR